MSSKRRESDSAALEVEDRDLGVVSTPLVDLMADITERNSPTAPVKIPNKNDLTVHLVNIDLLRRLDELRGDVSLYQTMFWTFLGIAFGFIVSFSTSGQVMTRDTWMLLFLGSAVVTIFGLLWHRATVRAQRIREKVFNE